MLESLTVWITTNWKISEEVGIPDNLTSLLKNLYAGQEATVRTGHGTMDWLQTGKGVHQVCICHPAYLTYMQSPSCKVLDWMNHKLESRLSGEISITSDITAGGKGTPLLPSSSSLSFSHKEKTKGCPGGTVGKNLPATSGNTRDVGLIPGSGRSHGVRNSTLLQYLLPGESQG